MRAVSWPDYNLCAIWISPSPPHTCGGEGRGEEALFSMRVHGEGNQHRYGRQSGAALAPHSKTCRNFGRVRWSRSVLECGARAAPLSRRNRSKVDYRQNLDRARESPLPNPLPAMRGEGTRGAGFLDVSTEYLQPPVTLSPPAGREPERGESRMFRRSWLILQPPPVLMRVRSFLG